MKNKILFLVLICSFNFIYSQKEKNISDSQLKEKTNEIDLHMTNENFQVASNLLSELIESDKNNKSLLFYKRAKCYYFLKKYEKAKKDINQSFKYYPKKKMDSFIKGGAYIVLGRIFSKEGKNRKALKAYLNATKYAEHSNLYSNIGYQLIALKKYKKAIDYLNNSIDLDSTNSYALNNRGLAYLKLGKYENSKKDINLSINLNPTNPYAFKHRALLFIENENYESACIDLENAKNLGYHLFGNDEIDKNEVTDLIIQFCK